MGISHKAVSVLLATLGWLPGLAFAGSNCTVIISEYVEGSSNNKAIEIYNPGPDAINLSSSGSNYVLQIYANGGTNPTASISLTGTVAAGATYVVAHTNLTAYANQATTAIAHNGDDAYILRRGGTSGLIVDSFGQMGVDPGTMWSNNGVQTLDRTLRRKSAVTAGDTTSTNAFDPSVEWDSYAVDTFTGLGAHTNDCGGGEPPADTPPVLNAIGAKSVGGGSNLQFTVTAMPTDGDTVTLTASNLPAGAAFYPTNEAASFLWTNASPTGTYSVTFNAADNDGFDAETVTITVNPSGGGGGGASDLIISEYVEGSANEKYIEIFNGTGGAVDLSDYKLQLYPNGTNSPTYNVTLSGTLANGAVKVYRNSSATNYSCDVNGSVNFNGDDAVALYKISSASYVDIFGRIGEDPGTAWTSGSLSTVNQTLVRKSSVTVGIATNPAGGFPTLGTEWDGYALDTLTNLGTHTSSGPATNQPPALAAIGNKTTEELTQLQFTISATDPTDGDTITLSMSNAPAMATLSSTHGNGTFTWAMPTPDGVYTATFYAIDKDGMDSETITLTVTPQEATVTSNLWHFEDDWQGWTNYSRASADNWSRANFPGAESTAWKMEMQGTSSDDWLIGPALDLSSVTDPLLTYWTKRSNLDISLQVKISTNYPGTGDPLAAGVSWATLPYTIPANRDVWDQRTNSLSAYVGHEQVHIAFYYYSGSGDSTVWSVDQIRYSATTAAASNAPPVLAPIGNKALVVSNNLMFPVQAVDPVDNDLITITVSNLPSGAEFTNDNGNGYFTWVNASPDGVYTSTFHAADKDGFDAETITITVSLPPGPTNPPVLAAIGNKSVIESNTLQFSVSAGDPDGDEIMLSAGGLPSGAVFSSTNGNGSFSWAVPTPVGVYTTVFYAADNDGTNSEAIVIYVNALAPTGTIVFQGFDGAPKDTWNFSGGGSNLSSAARTDGYGRQIGGTDSLIFSNVSLVGRFFSMLHVHCASTGGVENFDSLKVYVALDGAAFSEDPDVAILESNPTDLVYNATWSYDAAGIAATIAGTPASFYGDGASGYSTIRIKIPDGHTNVSVKIASDNTSSNEYYQIDDVELTSGSWVFHDPPVLASIGSRSGAEGSSLIFTVSADDSDGDPIALSATDLPAGAVFVDLGNGSGNFTWANPDSMGVWNTTFTAETSDGSDSEPVTIAIGEAVVTSNLSVTIMAANISSGTDQAYHEPGIRIFQALQPDVVCIQEFNYASGQRALVNTAFGTGHYYYVQSGTVSIPNGVISKYPILSSGTWDDTYMSDRDFAWAQIDLPGTTQDLYVVSLHIKSGDTADYRTKRNNEAILLTGYIATTNWPANSLIAVAGDFNTYSDTESCLTTLKAVATDFVRPADQAGDQDTSEPRSNPYDRVLTSTNLHAKRVSTVVGATTFSNGIVFDTAKWGSSVPAPAASDDSHVEGMQHMAVMKTFQIASAPPAVTSATIYTIAGLGGVIAPVNPAVALGGSKTFTISNSAGYVISDVKVDGVSIGATNRYTLSDVTNSRSIAATFQADVTLQLVVIDPNGPNSGTNTNRVSDGSSQRCTNDNLTVTAGTTQFVLKGWTGTGSAPASGTTTVTAAFTMTQNSSVQWLWNTNYWFDSTAGANGSVNVGDQWIPSGSNVTITATPNQYYNFSVWTGHPPSGQESSNSVTVSMTSPKTLAANFVERLATHNVPEWWLAQHGWTNDFDSAALGDPDGDTLFTWQEYVAGTIPTNELSLFYVETRSAAAAGPTLLTWPSATGRWYDVDVRTDALTGAWTSYETNIPASTSVNVYTGSLGQSDRLYFRVKVRHP